MCMWSRAHFSVRAARRLLLSRQTAGPTITPSPIPPAVGEGWTPFMRIQGDTSPSFSDRVQASSVVLGSL
eukprot:gene9386-biopygen8584